MEPLRTYDMVWKKENISYYIMIGLFLCQIGWIAVGGTIFSTIRGEKWSKAMHSPTTWDTKHLIETCFCCNYFQLDSEVLNLDYNTVI